MTIDFKGVFRNKNREQRKINDLERLESRRWVNCMETDFDVNNGLMQTRSFIIDTDAAIIDVSGNINLAQEQLDLTINPNSKGLRVLSLRAPLYVRGSFNEPSVSIDKEVLAMKAGGAIALAVLAPVALAPIAALIPLINAGPGEDSDCAKLLADAHVKPVAPRPGQDLPQKSQTQTQVNEWHTVDTGDIPNWLAQNNPQITWNKDKGFTKT